MKRWLIGIGVVLIALFVAGWIFRGAIGLAVFTLLIKPSTAFAESGAPTPPNYSDATYWAALPDKVDNADFALTSEPEAQAGAKVDVFFVHPTTYYKREHWNQPLDDVSANTMTDEAVLRAQASVFNASCKVYAPRYRQATLASFLDRSGSGEQALKLAYEDVEAAFDYFIEHFSTGRPFILAGHSQGSMHLETLLDRRVSETDLLSRLVAVYAIGAPISAAEFARDSPDIPVCQDEDDTGCLITWNTVGPNALRLRTPADGICVNPLTWNTDGAYAGHDLNLGGLGAVGDASFVAGVADAQCRDGRLVVTEIRSPSLLRTPRMLGRENYHLLDYNLFYLNLRRNVATRVEAFLGKRQGAAN